MNQSTTIAPASGKLGVLMPGMGAVATTVIAGVEAIKAGIGAPIGSLTQMGTIRLGKRTDGHAPLIKDFVSLAELDDLVFGTWDPIPDDGYQVDGMGSHDGEQLGRLELLTIDRRDEANVDEFYKLGSLRDLREMNIEPSFVVTGNAEVVLRESLLPEAFVLAEAAVASSLELEEDSRGMVGPFCLECIVTDQLEFRVFEVSARIVAGSNVSIGGSPYTNVNELDMSVGRRIARSIRKALEKDRLEDILS